MRGMERDAQRKDECLKQQQHHQQQQQQHPDPNDHPRHPISETQLTSGMLETYFPVHGGHDHNYKMFEKLSSNKEASLNSESKGSIYDEKWRWNKMMAAPELNISDSTECLPIPYQSDKRNKSWPTEVDSTVNQDVTKPIQQSTQEEESGVNRTWRSNSLYPTLAQDQLHLNDLLNTTRISRSSSLTSNSLNVPTFCSMDTLKLPDPRRLSFASDGSAISSASSLSDIWGHDSNERKQSYPFGALSMGPQSEAYQSIDLSKRVSNKPEKAIIKRNEFFPGSGCNEFYDSRNLGIYSNDSDRRSSGIGSEYDSDRNNSRQSFSYDQNTALQLSESDKECMSGSHSIQRFNELDRRSSSLSNYSDRRIDEDLDRRNSGMSNCSDRRSSGFASDSDRRDSNTSDRMFPQSVTSFRSPSFSNIKSLEHQHTNPIIKIVENINENTIAGDEECQVRPGMKNVPNWLKSLRLHKYNCLIMSFNYEEMLNITEEQLSALNVTKGARRKIANSMKKLKDRLNILLDIDREIEKGSCDMKKLLSDIEAVLRSPINNFTNAEPIASETNKCLSQDVLLEGQQIVDKTMVTLRKVCSTLLLSPTTDTKHVYLFSGLLDICLSQDCYSEQQKQLLASWQHKIFSIWGSLQSSTTTVPLQKDCQNKGIRQPCNWSQPTHPSFISRRYSLQNRYNSMSVRHPVPETNRDVNSFPVPTTTTFTPPTHPPTPGPAHFQHRRSVPNIKFSPNIPLRQHGVDESVYLPPELFSYQSPSHNTEPHHTNFPLKLQSSNILTKTDTLQEERTLEKENSFKCELQPTNWVQDFNLLPEDEKHFPLVTRSNDPITEQNLSETELQNESDLNSRLESLCISVTEHALRSDSLELDSSLQ